MEKLEMKLPPRLELNKDNLEQILPARDRNRERIEILDGALHEFVVAWEYLLCT